MKSRLKIYKLNGAEVPLSAYGLLGLELIVEAPSYNLTKEFAEGRNGQIHLGKTLNPRNLIARFKVDAHDFSDSLLLRDELFVIFNGFEKFYISEAKQPGKRWLVECAEPWTPERFNARTSTISLPLVCDEGTAESVATTLNLRQWDDDVWQWGQGLTWDDYSYTHTSQNFIIYNAGNVAIDPRFMDLKITIKAVGAQYIQLTNLRTNEIYRCNTALSTNDTLVIDGIRTTRNGLSVTRDTNFKLLSLLPGENSFQVTGATIQSISFDFRFRYL